MDLSEFLKKIPDRDKLSPSQLIPYFMYYLHYENDLISASQIQTCFDILRIKAYSNIPAWLGTNSKGKNAMLIKNKNGYTLTRKCSDRISHEIENDSLEEIMSNDRYIEDSFKSKIQKFIEKGIDIKKKESTELAGRLKVSGEQYSQWMAEIKLFSQRYLKEHPLYQDIQRTYFHKNTSGSYEDMMGYLRILENDIPFKNSKLVQTNNNGENNLEKRDIVETNKIFIVHGHDNLAKEQVARVVEKAGFEAIILHEKASGGKTIIEKIEKYSDVSFAIVLYTPCDLGRDKNLKEDNYRARQNVIFEHGYLIGKLGREHVCALVKENVETPGDISGVVYVQMDDAGAWKMDVAKEMEIAGLKIDFNKFI